MILIDMEMPRECHECPMQKQFKDSDDGKIDDFYMRRCVITGRIIEYPKPEWCPLKPLTLCENCKHWDSKRKGKQMWVDVDEDGEEDAEE